MIHTSAFITKQLLLQTDVLLPFPLKHQEIVHPNKMFCNLSATMMTGTWISPGTMIYLNTEYYLFAKPKKDATFLREPLKPCMACNLIFCVFVNDPSC